MSTPPRSAGSRTGLDAGRLDDEVEPGAPQPLAGASLNWGARGGSAIAPAGRLTF